MPRPTASAAAPAGERSPSSSRWPPLLLIGVVLLTFGRLTAAQFTWFDDHATVVANPHFNPPHWAGVGYYWTHTDPEIYAPLTYTLWGALAAATYVPTPDDQGAHVDPRFYHAANVLLHLAAALCVYALLRELRSGDSPWAAAAGAMLFALHPLQVEAVAWVTGTRDLLGGALSLLALWLYVRAARRASRGWFVASTVAFAAAMLAKPGSIPMPLVALILDRLLLGRPWRRVLPAVAAWGAMAAPLVLVNWLAQQAVHASAVPRWFRWVLPGDTLTFYLGKLLLPVGLAIQYPLRPMEMMHHAWAYGGWLVPLAFALLLWRLRRRWLWAAMLVFVAAPLPLLGFLPFDWQWSSAVADHYLYVAMLGPAVALTYALAHAKWRSAYGGTAAYLAVLAALSFRQAGFWADNATLARHTLGVNPRSFVAHTILGSELLATDPAGAARELRAAFEIEPNYVKAAGALKQLLDLLGRPDEAREVMIRSVAANESLPPGQQLDATESYRLLARDFESRGDPARAAEYYRKLLARLPNDADARAGLERVTHAAATQP